MIGRLLTLCAASIVGTLFVPNSGALAAANCARPASGMERTICSEPAIAARDAAMSILYRSAVLRNAGPVREAQRRWLAYALACGDRGCLTERYDERNSVLLETDGARPLVRRFRLRRRGADGELFLFQSGGWITYGARETVIGSRGEAAGDVDAVSLSGTARLEGPVATEVKAGGCEVTLQLNADRSWSLGTRHCLDGAGADLNERFYPIGR